MGEALARRYDFVSSLFEEISRRSGVDLPATFFGERAPDLHADLPAQVGVFAVSIAVLEVLERVHGMRPSAVAGYSLGTYAAFVAAGSLERRAALDVLLEAERLLREEREAGNIAGTMGFVIGLSREEIEELIADVTADPALAARPAPVSIGTENAARQFVLTGKTSAVETAMERARPKALKAEMLPIDFPMHSELLAPVCRKLDVFLEGNTEKRGQRGSGRVMVGAPRIPLYAPMLGRRVQDAAEASLVLSQQISHPSLWSATLRAMGEAGFTRFAEIGPGDVLTKMLRWTLREAQGTFLDAPSSIDSFLSYFSKQIGPGAVTEPATTARRV